MDVIGGLLLLGALLGFLLGMINPRLVVWWGAKRSRARVVLICGTVFVIGIGFAVVGAPSDFEAGRDALKARDYAEAATRLEAVTPTDPGYAEARRLLPEARRSLLESRLAKAGEASRAGRHAEVVSQLADYPSEGPGAADAAKLLSDSRAAVDDAERQRAAAEERRRLQARIAEEAKAQERLMADFPRCDSEDAEKQVADALENAPLGRVYGLSLIKIKNAKQVPGSAISRNCTGTGIMNDSNAYTMTFRFYRDGDDLMIEAEVLDLDG